jgi:hypothetical protein
MLKLDTVAGGQRITSGYHTDGGKQPLVGCLLVVLLYVVQNRQQVTY